MKKYRFWCNGGKTVETFWFDDTVNIEQKFNEWVNNNEDVGYEEII